MARAKPETASETKPTKAPAAKAAKAPKAEKAPKAPKAETGEKRTRTPGGERGWLAREVEKHLRKAAKDGEQMTVAELVEKITNVHGEHPSSGAVAAVLVRWNEQNYIELTGSRPQAFKRFVAKYREKTLDDFLTATKDAKAKARAAAKADKAA